MTPHGRADAMAARLARTADRLGIGAGTAAIERAFRHAMQARTHLDDHHPDYLHPARVVLILMEDVGLTDAAALAAAALVETRDPGLRPRPGAAGGIGSDVLALAAAVPRPDEAGDALLEALLAAPDDVRMIALAERLDHARHLHLRDRQEWEPGHATTCAVYAPVAGRSHPALARRFDWWCATFRRRFLGP